MKSGENYNSRRSFVKKITAFAIAAVVPNLLNSCRNKVLELGLKLTGTNHILGHRLWLKNFPKPTKEIKIPYLIIGAGISGLSAARQFKKSNIDEFLVLELENKLGGNSANGENRYSKFPLAAHYLPLPNIRDKELLSFLEESKIIVGYKNNLPVFDEAQLCFDPNERLFIRNSWQTDLIPRYGNLKEVDDQIDTFLKKMSEFREKKGGDGKYFFDIPMSFCSKDSTLDYLDSKTMKIWMLENKFDSEEVFEYVNYCCRDDFGLGVEFVSAWAGIHYFASRKHENINYGNTVLTWPEGNGRLVKHLKSYVEGNVLSGHLVYEVKTDSEGVEVLVFDTKSNESITISAEKVIVATPQYITKYLIPNRKELVYSFQYAPWFTASLTLSEIPDNGSFPLSWDNVIYKGKGLGYVYNQHQNLEQIIEKKVITYYYSFSSNDISTKRSELLKRPVDYWKMLVLSDLEIAHPGIEKYILDIEIHRIGHGMISPVPNFIKGNVIKEVSKNIENKVFFAHSDLAGISIFEEAFHQGINIVNEIVNETTLDS
ncbi:FAD-dependent oxidoreductase [Flavobacterium chuncheonense]|uniref:FAD-dependent oxidoreductase n=1 Tax=Flavobacterium chuncheonense TaxID=2026653 RepID=A0ABW5YN77_9FLAO